MRPERASYYHSQLAALAARARAPYSGRADTAAVVLADGTWVPGVRVETASFPLIIDAAVNAVTTALASGRSDFAAVVLSAPVPDAQVAYLGDLPFARLEQVDPVTFVAEAFVDELPEGRDALDPFLKQAAPATLEEAVDLARATATHAYAPLSEFPVGCIVELEDGRLLPGVNVEHPDWNRILCAERNALGTAVSYGALPARTIVVSCPRDEQASSCGACRQVIAELAPDSSIVMDRGNARPDSQTAKALLPGSFTGSAIPTRRRRTR